MLNTDTEKGVSGDESDLTARKNAFGSNTYPRKKGKSFVVCIWFSYIDMAVAVFSLGVLTPGVLLLFRLLFGTPLKI